MAGEGTREAREGSKTFKTGTLAYNGTSVSDCLCERLKIKVDSALIQKKRHCYNMKVILRLPGPGESKGTILNNFLV